MRWESICRSVCLSVCLLLGDDKEVAYPQDRPVQIFRPVHNQVYFEKKSRRRSGEADRWNTSGGVKGSTVWPSTGQPRVRRRYGRVTTRLKVLGSPSLRFVMYSLVRKEEDDICMEPGRRRSKVPPLPDHEPRLYQIMIDDPARQHGPSGGRGAPTDVLDKCQLDDTASVFIKPELGSAAALSLPRKRQRAGPIVPPPPRSAGEWVACRSDMAEMAAAMVALSGGTCRLPPRQQAAPPRLQTERGSKLYNTED